MTVRRSQWIRLWAALAIGAAVAEFIWIATAAALGTRSHYNTTIPWLQTLYETAMGPIAIVLAMTAAAFGWSLLRHATDEVTRAAGWSFIATTLLTIPIGLVLSFAPVAGAGLPFLGWTLQPGDLRPAHFMATHAMQVVPLAIVALAALGSLRRGTGLLVTALWSALTLAAFAYAAT